MTIANRHDAAPAGISRRRMLLATGAGIAAAGVAPTALVAAAQSGTPAATDDAVFSTDIQLGLQQIVNDGLAATETPGVLIGVWYPGQGTWRHAGGIGDLATAAPVSLDDHVRIASNTKTFVATVVLQLVDEGLVGLDDPIDDYVPGVPNGEEITVRQVIGMTSGVADYITVPELAKEYDVNPLMVYTPDDALAYIRESTSDFVPGTSIHYSNSNYILLGFLIEVVTGQSAGRAVTERIIEPLGLTGTSFATTPTMPEPYMHGYNNPALGENLVDVTRSNPWVAWTAGAIISTLDDLRVWVEALATGALLTPETQTARLEGTELLPGGPSYGLGIIEWNGLLGHNGGIAGYSSWMMSDPELGFTIVIVANRSGEQGGSADAFFRPILGLLMPDRFGPSATATPTA